MRALGLFPNVWTQVGYQKVSYAPSHHTNILITIDQETWYILTEPKKTTTVTAETSVLQPFVYWKYVICLLLSLDFNYVYLLIFLPSVNRLK